MVVAKSETHNNIYYIFRGSGTEVKVILYKNDKYSCDPHTLTDEEEEFFRKHKYKML